METKTCRNCFQKHNGIKHRTLQKNNQPNLLLLEFPANSNMIDTWEHKEEAGFADYSQKKVLTPLELKLSSL